MEDGATAAGRDGMNIGPKEGETMKAVLDGKRYDTETAQEIAADGHGHSSDFNHWRESLYRTKQGAFFLAGSGGARSKYARNPRQNEWTGGERITVLTEAEALRWCEDHEIDADVIAEHFAIEEA
jgi:hypothetical protein